MPGITNITLQVAGRTQTWSLPEDHATYPGNINLAAGQTASLPYLGSAKEATRQEFSLLSVRANTFVSDHFEAIKIVNGLIEVSDLPRAIMTC